MEAGCVVAALIEHAASGPQDEPGSCDVLQRHFPPFTDLGEDEGRTNNLPEEKQQQQTSTAMVRSDDITAEPLLRSCVSTASMKVKNMKKLTFPKGHFPRLAECAHFHYENVDFGNVQLTFAEGQNEGPKTGLDSKELVFLIQIGCQGRSWLVKRSYEDFRVLDKHLHLCIYDRRYSELVELPRNDTLKDTAESVTKMLASYLSRFSAIADNKINCGPVLTWMEIDNKGNHLLVSEEASINVPAIAAAHVTKRYTAQATDELTFEVGDIVSVIDMPPKEDTGWWRGKHGFQVGFFPCDCVELINDKIPPSVQSSVPKPVCKKHGKLVTFLRTFMKSRPPPQKLRQRGILRERVFGCDLGEHLHNSGHEVPQVVKSCADFIEKHGVVDGIYRLSGISSNIQKLRHEFDSEQIPDLTRDIFRQDIHSVGSLCKLYFRELPNPLLTYQLYDRFSEAVSAATDEERLVKIHNVIQQLPPPHYRTLEHLMRHLSHLATFSSVTNMHTKNLAIVWAPNLLRSRQIESACFSGTAAFMEVRIQSVVVEFILNNTEALFSPKLSAIIRESTGNNNLSRPKSLLVCSPSTKLLSLEEAQARTQAQLGSPATPPCVSHSDYIEVGEGPGALLGKFHTVIELPVESKRPPAKAKKSPVGNWLSFFHLGKSQSVSKRKLKRHPSEPNEIKSIALPGGRGDSGTLRSTKSEESLTSLHNVEGDPRNYRPRRPRSTSQAISVVRRDDQSHTRSKGDHRTHPLTDRNAGSDRGHSTACVSPPQQEDDLDLCPPAAGISSLDFDPMSFQCSPPSAIPGLQHTKGGNKGSKSVGCSSESEPISSPNNNISSSQSPDISPILGNGGREATPKSLSPKLRKKSFKTQADVQRASDSSPLLLSVPPPGEKREGQLAEGKVGRPSYQHRSPASALTDLSQSAQNLPDPGAAGLMSSVSVLLPHPPSTSAARKLALALAESAHMASSGAQRTGDIPSHRFRRAEAPHVQEKPPRPSVLNLRDPSQNDSQWQTSARNPMGSHCCRHPVHFLPAHLDSEPLQVTDGQESISNLTPNVSPLGWGSLEDCSAERSDSRAEKELRDVTRGEPTCQSVGVSTPTQPACSTHSQSTSPVYVNTDSINIFNFRAVLAETSMPASIEEVLPRSLQPPPSHLYNPEEPPLGPSEDVYSIHRHQHHRPIQAGRLPARRCLRPGALPRYQFGQKGVYRQSSEGHCSTLGFRHPWPPHYGHQRCDEHLISGHLSPWQRSEDRMLWQPAIRRARSFHAPQLSRYELAERADVLPPDSLFYTEHMSSQEVPYQRLIQTGISSVQPQFENSRADYRYSPYFDINPIDGACYYVEAGQQRGVQHGQPNTMRSKRESRQSDYYNYSPKRLPPMNREFHVESRDAEMFERFAYRPVKHEGKSRPKKTCLPISPTESPSSPVDSRGTDVMHTRSRSDPGNACLLSISRAENQDSVLATSPTSPRSQQADLEVTDQQYGQRSSAEPGPHGEMQIKRQPPLRKVPSLPERGCPSLKNVEHNNRSHTRGHNQEGLTTAKSGSSYSGAVKPGILRRPGRSQSTRENRHHHYQHIKSSLEPEQLGYFSTQPTRRTQSTKVKPTLYDHTEGHYATPKPKSTRSSKAGGGYLPSQGCMSPHGHRLLSNALGQEVFYHTPLRSEAGVYE
ncbi:rho GTPase-activating protein 32-like [Brachionichthys hirsutus]|uniref:rho GTPase-activating protein 32-like n=1 Tax=Brachionichthys hirsutus TaxID=412623 RepID=UPI0036050AF5